MKISQGFVKILARLRNGEVIRGGEVKEVLKLLEPMFREGGLNKNQLTKSRFEIQLTNLEHFDLYIKTKFNIEDLDSYLSILKNNNATRAEMLTSSSDDKAKKINPFDGVYISSYDNIDICIDGKQTKLDNVNGSVLFISSSCQLEISKEILVVGVENAENLLFLSRQIGYFSHLNQEKIFIFRNPFMLDWLSQIENNYLHYGDFDFAGISIYVSQILPRVKAHRRFFIPSNIEEMIQKGQSDLYYKHYAYKSSIGNIDDELDGLIALIDAYKKTVRQEFLIYYRSKVSPEV